jgi:DNA processing protein
LEIIVTNVVASSPTAAHLLEWVALTMTPGLGPTRTRKLVERFGSADASFSRVTYGTGEHGDSSGVGTSAGYGEVGGAGTRRNCARCGGGRDPRFIRRCDPPRLKEIYDPPLVLYARGNAEVLTRPGIAIVGTRHPTPYGLGMAERLACDLATHGLVIISGMARGVDTASHRGAIAAKGKTVTAFGTGVDVIYPDENSRLSEQILALGGALISEFPIGTFPAPQNFPIRNRILSGMSVGVLVVEAAEYSGRALTRAARWNKIATCSRCRAK